MKTILILLFPLFSFSQGVTFAILDSVTINMDSNEFEIEFEIEAILDSAENITDNPGDLTINGDTACAVLFLMRKLDATNELLWATEDVLACIKTSGYITDRRRFTRAVNKYMKLKKFSYRYK